MSKKKKLNRSVDRKSNKKYKPSLAENNLRGSKVNDSTTSHLSLNGKNSRFKRRTNIFKDVWVIFKKRSVFFPLMGILIVALIVSGVSMFLLEGKDNHPDPAIGEKSISDTDTTISPSTDKLEIEDVVVTDITEESLTVAWRTSRPSTSEVLAYERDTGFSIAGWPDNNLVQEHKVILKGLAPSTVYNLKIQSKDASGYQAMVEVDKPYQTLSIHVSTDLAVGELGPDFTLPTVAGEKISLTDFNGKRIMIVFWKASCRACREELPHLNDFWENSTYDDFMLLTVNVKEKEALVINYVESQKLMFPVLLDIEGKISEKYSVANFPTTFLVAADGTIDKIKEDTFKNEKEIDQFVRSNIKVE